MVRLRPIALPTEHGGWSLLAAPILLGLRLAPSAADAWLSLAALGAFLTRQPLELAWGRLAQPIDSNRDWIRNAWRCFVYFKSI
jgi:hypothetical protein